jgi:hypothetical protein
MSRLEVHPAGLQQRVGENGGSQQAAEQVYEEDCCFAHEPVFRAIG